MGIEQGYSGGYFVVNGLFTYQNQHQNWVLRPNHLPQNTNEQALQAAGLIHLSIFPPSSWWTFYDFDDFRNLEHLVHLLDLNNLDDFDDLNELINLDWFEKFDGIDDLMTLSSLRAVTLRKLNTLRTLRLLGKSRTLIKKASFTQLPCLE